MKLISVKEVSELLDCSIQAVRALDTSGELSCETRQSNQRRYSKAKVLSYIASRNTIDTYAFVGVPKDDEHHLMWRESVLEFCTNNNLPKITIVDDYFEGIANEPLLLARHFTAQIIEHRPKNLVLGCPDLIDPSSLPTILSVCKLYRINVHFLFGATTHE